MNQDSIGIIEAYGEVTEATLRGDVSDFLQWQSAKAGDYILIAKAVLSQPITSRSLFVPAWQIDLFRIAQKKDVTAVEAAHKWIAAFDIKLAEEESRAQDCGDFFDTDDHAAGAKPDAAIRLQEHAASAPHLVKLIDACHQFWSTYDPDDPTTAPTNAEVQDWLSAQGVAERVAEVMAQILRPKGLPSGPRRHKRRG